VRSLRARGHDVVGLDRLPSAFTDVVGSITDADLVARCLRGVDAVLHAATLHKPHVATHAMADFVATNVTGTLVLLEAAVAAGVGAFVFTSSTSAFGNAMRPAAGAPAVWVTEDLAPAVRNIYGATKVAAEDLCQVVHRRHGLPCIVLRTSRFFGEVDDDPALRGRFSDANIKLNELLYRRVELQDVVDAHRLALDAAPALRWGRYVVTATSPLRREHLAALRGGAADVVRELVPQHVALFDARGYTLFDDIDRVYVNHRARDELGWAPRTDFAQAVSALARGDDWRSPLALAVGVKPYHAQAFADGPYPVHP
jgi:UDP-glucose 4-epimerase